MSAPNSTIFVPSSSSEPLMSEVVKPPVSEVVKHLEVTPPRKIRVDLKESKDKSHDKPAWVCHFCGKFDTFVQTITSCKLLRE